MPNSSKAFKMPKCAIPRAPPPDKTMPILAFVSISKLFKIST